MPTITNAEMERRKLMAEAKSKLTEAMGRCEELTAMEWDLDSSSA